MRQVWKNNGSAVETEPHGETWATRDENTRNITGLARAALEREREVRAYRAEAADRGRSQGVNPEKQSWRRKRRSGGEDSLGNRADSPGNRSDSLGNRGVVPRAYIPVFSTVFPCYTVRRLNASSTAARTGSSPAVARADGEANADGNWNLPREVGADRDIQADARTERGDGDAHSRGFESAAATAARRCMWRESMLTASTAAVAVTVEPVSAERTAAAALTQPLLSAVVQDVPDIPEVVGERSGAAIP